MDPDAVDYTDDVMEVLDLLDARFGDDFTDGLTLVESVEAALSATLDPLMVAYAEFLKDLRTGQAFTVAALLLCQDEAARRGWGPEGPEASDA